MAELGIVDGARFRGPAYETARLKLAKFRLEGGQAREGAFRHLARVTVETLSVDRVSVFSLAAAGRRLVSQVTHDCDCADEQSQCSFALGDCGDLRMLLEAGRVVALEEKDTASLGAFTAQYLAPRDMVKVVLAPVLSSGSAAALISIESKDPAHKWDDPQLNFATSVADLAALVLTQIDKLELEVALNASAEMHREAEKMQALVRMSRGVAHDIRNLLVVVSSVAETLSDQGDSTQSAKLHHVVGASTAVLDQLTTFSAATPPQEERVDLAACIAETREVLEAHLSGERRLRVEILTQADEVHVDFVSVRRILLNLVDNARVALGPSGEIVVRVRVPEPEDVLSVGSVVLEVEDDGAGMDGATQARAAEPYFTTRADPRGHGLGLPLVFGIAQRYGGGVRIVSKLGRGTRVAVALRRG